MAEAPMDVDDDYEKEDAEGGYEKAETPTSVSYAPWLFERRQENEERNVYQLPDESGKWMMFYHVDVINDAWSRAKTLYRSGLLPNIQSMKVSTAMPTQHPSTEHVMIFYCGPASDKNKMMTIGRDLAEQMHYDKPAIYYKTDLQTIQGISGSTYQIQLR